MRRRLLELAVVTGCLLAMMQTATAGTVGFTADVRRTHARQPQTNAEGRIMVGEEGVRTEAVVNGNPVVIIYHTKSRQVWTILPRQRQFTRLADERLDLGLPPTPRDANSPCRTDARFECVLRGQEKVGHRTTEYWEVRFKATPKETRTDHLWIDPELGVAIRERHEDGTLVEMQNIQLVAPDRQLFQLPAGLQEVSMPLPGGSK